MRQWTFGLFPLYSAECELVVNEYIDITKENEVQRGSAKAPRRASVRSRDGRCDSERGPPCPDRVCLSFSPAHPSGRPKGCRTLTGACKIEPATPYC
jgi:hypothetical protein